MCDCNREEDRDMLCQGMLDGHDMVCCSLLVSGNIPDTASAVHVHG